MKYLLSIDSGLGLGPAQIIRNLAIDHQVPMSGIFDMIAGSGSGAITALLLAAGWGEAEAQHFFSEGRYLKKSKWRNARSNDKGTLRALFGQGTLEDAHVPVCVPVYSMENRSTDWVYSGKNPHVRLLSLAMAASAVPGVCKPGSLFGEKYCSGELFMPDPSVNLYTEALKKWPGEEFVMLSLSGKRLEIGPERLASKKDWGEALPSLPHTRASVVMDGLQHHTDLSYFRVTGDYFSDQMAEFKSTLA